MSPPPRDLLAARLALGWRPLPSPMNDGPRVLGFARCLDDGSCADLAAIAADVRA